jgi:hypothetical protein
MPRVQRLSHLIEIQAEHAVYYGFSGLALSALGVFLIAYRGSSGMFVPLAIILLLIGIPLIAIAIRAIWRVRDVKGVVIICPICNAKNEILEVPTEDFSCEACSRLIPIRDGQVLPVQQVRCGFCNELNYYSDNTDALLCENCNHEIPLAGHEDRPKKAIPKAYMIVDDEQSYELIIVGRGKHKEEELITALQHMLALNRNQVKQMLDELPVTVLTGINRKKAEMLKAQLGIYDAEVELRPMQEVRQ